MKKYDPYFFWPLGRALGFQIISRPHTYQQKEILPNALYNRMYIYFNEKVQQKPTENTLEK